MRMKSAVTAIGLLLSVAGPALSQTPEIQDKVEKKLDQVRKEQAGLEELLSMALKQNPDIRVAESKVREAEAQLYRARVNGLNRVVMQYHEVRSAKAAADEAASRYKRDQDLTLRTPPAIAPAELSASQAAMLKFQADHAVKEAELDMLIGKHSAKAAEWLRIFDTSFIPVDGTGKPVPPISKPGNSVVAPAAVPDPMADKIRKALDAPFKAAIKGEVTEKDVLELLREQTKGVNFVNNVGGGNDRIRTPDLTQPVPLGAFYQWAEDQFGWRFIVRDYGIVATLPDVFPPDAVLLMNLWRKAPPAGAP